MSEQQLIDAAKASTIGYNEKDWDKVRASITADFVYDEVATHGKVEGIDQVIEVWRGWATALPDSRATFDDAFIGGDKVVLEVTWRGTHTGPLQTPNGEIAATGKSIEIRACQIVEVEDGKAKSMRQYFDMMTMMRQLGLTE
jgi:steroid delta-isomerase-like uncharacterized protein